MYMGIFENMEDVFNEFREPVDKEINILLAWYGGECYEGSAFVLFERAGKLYEVNGGHCSCMGLEEQWEPEETSIAALRHRMKEGYLGYFYQDEDNVREVLDKVLTDLELRK